MNEHLTVNEYVRGQQALERAISAGFARMDSRFNRLDDLNDQHAERLAVNEARLTALEAVEKSAPTKKATAVWSTGIATVVVGLIEAFRQLAK